MLADILYGRLVSLQVFLDTNVHADFNFPGHQYFEKLLAILLAILILVLVGAFVYSIVMIVLTIIGKKQEGVATYAIGAVACIIVLALIYQGTHFPERFAHYISS